MKKVMLLILGAFLSDGCRKDGSTDLNGHISGVVVDAVQQKPVPGIEVYVNNINWDGWNYTITKAAGAVTDADGRFELRYRMVSEWDAGVLKVAQIPPEFQNGARINGDDTGCIAAHDWEEFFGYTNLKDEGFYKIEFMPPTFARIVPPPILPVGWENDTLTLDISNLCVDQSCGSSYCGNNFYSRVFRMDNAAVWAVLAQSHPIGVGNRVGISFRVSNGGVKKSGNITTECVFGDTTAIVLPIGP